MVSSIKCFKKNQNCFLHIIGTEETTLCYCVLKQDLVVSISVLWKGLHAMFSVPKSIRNLGNALTTLLFQKSPLLCNANAAVKAFRLIWSLFSCIFLSNNLARFLRVVFSYRMCTVAYVKLWKKYAKPKNMTFKSMVELHSFYNHQSNSVLL